MWSENQEGWSHWEGGHTRTSSGCSLLPCNVVFPHRNSLSWYQFDISLILWCPWHCGLRLMSDWYQFEWLSWWWSTSAACLTCSKQCISALIHSTWSLNPVHFLWAKHCATFVLYGSASKDLSFVLCRFFCLCMALGCWSVLIFFVFKGTRFVWYNFLRDLRDVVLLECFKHGC